MILNWVVANWKLIPIVEDQFNFDFFGNQVIRELKDFSIPDHSPIQMLKLIDVSQGFQNHLRSHHHIEGVPWFTQHMRHS